MTVAGLVLAAGEGRRLGRPKALVELDGERLVDRAVRVLRDAGCAPLYVVSGAVPLQVPGAVVVDNAQWRAGMSTSLRAGLEGVATGTDAETVVVCLVDQPGIGSDVVRRLLAAGSSAAAGGPSAVVATYDGQPRNPVLLARAVWDEVAESATGDHGARRWLTMHPERVRAVECGDLGDPRDIDTPEDLATPPGES